MKICIAILAALVLLAGTADAATRQTRKCPPTCRQHRTHAKPAAPVCAPALDTVYVIREVEVREIPQPAPKVGVWNELLTGFEIQAGFRWEREHACPPFSLVPVPHETPPMVDPFYLGVGLRLPLSTNAGLFGNFDRDWTEAPNFQVRTGLYWAPWR